MARLPQILLFSLRSGFPPPARQFSLCHQTLRKALFSTSPRLGQQCVRDTLAIFLFSSALFLPTLSPSHDGSWQTPESETFAFQKVTTAKNHRGC